LDRGVAQTGPAASKPHAQAGQTMIACSPAKVD